jgi:hypothetical protein
VITDGMRGQPAELMLCRFTPITVYPDLDIYREVTE